MQLVVGIITVSDRASRGIYEDLGGPGLKAAAQGRGWQVIKEHLCRMKSQPYRKRSTIKSGGLPIGADHGRHRCCLARRYTRSGAGDRGSRTARIWRDHENGVLEAHA